LIALLNWVARPGRISALLAGVVTALATLYTYQPLKLLPLLVVVWLAWLFFTDRDRFKELRAGLIPFGAAFLLVGAPMLAVAITETSSYFGRAAEVSTFNPGVAADSSLPIHILRTIAMFGYTGDGNQRHDVASLPLLPLPLAVLMALGVWRLWKSRRDPAHALILLSLPIFMIPPIVATEGYSPHFLRALGLAAPLGVTIGLGAAELVEQVRRRWNRPVGGRASAPIAAITAIALTLAAVAVWSGWVYLNRPIADRYVSFSYEANAAGEYAAGHPGSLVIIDNFAGTDVVFLNWNHQPAMIEPGTQIADPSAYTAIIALRQSDISNAVGAVLGNRAQPVAWDPSGKPAVWAVAP